ncbi:uncharacterized protein LOC134267976 [Saccostrea cucullata]|uniref:uncharacterized protein LOC134267976 n=1 Tax=Saccostrea cuccullata TaxID=36930 RepID=UPI002ED3C5E5
MALWKFHFILFKFLSGSMIIYSSVEQQTWKVMDAMNDIVTQKSVSYHLSNVACTECALRTKLMNEKSFSCHQENQTCLIYSTCHVKSRLLTSEWEPSEGWRHFCTAVHTITFGGDPWINIDTLITSWRRTSIRFQIKATRDAHVGLVSGNTTASSGYQVILGGWYNTESCIRDGFVYGSTCSSTSLGSHLSGAQFSSFWINWHTGRIEVGLGDTLGHQTIMDYTFPNVYQINNLLLRNRYSSQCEWIIYL